MNLKKTFATAVASAALALPGALMAAPAHADGHGVGTNTGNGSCSYSNVGWKYTPGIGGVKATDRSSCYNTGQKLRDLRRVGAAGCAGDGVVGVFSLTERRAGQWATWPQRGLKAASKMNASRAIGQSSAPKRVKWAAKRKLADQNNVIVCVFKRDLA